MIIQQVTRKCHASSSLTKVEEVCQGQQSCSILASNSVFGDPCVGTYKYLKVEYECVQKLAKIVCEHSTLSLRCEGNTDIYILSASYGRNVGTSICQGGTNVVTRKCHASSSLTKVEEACQGQQSCSILASNSVFGDPCVGTYKYLKVEYECELFIFVLHYPHLKLPCS
ncbi:L-rhamnose-binding lectin CSL3 [Holothuria leucospilota]|uniref:L-rhamnose-binding lectin CSL3 n=1 Tax=Holothuria leucospilota TaxID=206669 RepID=A0A9Q1HCK7_HOLLE|nr:L-rhamnose-binding lectin CSL3 [Holothuria leucospilota]